MTSDHATRFHQLHAEPAPLLLLANAWDAGSARLMESLGAQAVATTSAGVAWSHGYPDGDALPVAALAGTVAAITRVIGIPLTVDAEGGYSDDPAQAAEAIAALLDAGAVGINIEDGAAPPDLLCAKIERIRAVAEQRGVNLFINARTDVYLRGLAPEGGRVGEVLTRAARYREAGASGIFVPGATDGGEIRAIAAGTDLPLNVMARPTLPPAAELAKLGVRRLSAGSAISQAAWGRAADLARAFLADGRSDPLGESAMDYPAINALFS